MKKHYTFIEVGTADFHTMIEKVNDDTVGLAIEPHKTYLDRLPNKRNVTKVWGALVPDELYDKSGLIDFYYVDEKIIKEKKLGFFLRGSNSVGKPHEFHINWFPQPSVWLNPSTDRSALKSVNLLKKGLVTVEKVPCLTYAMLAEQFNIGSVEFLKIDAEGQDSLLLRSVLNYCISNNTRRMLPRQVCFETNSLTDSTEVENIKDYMRKLGYTIDSPSGHDAWAILEDVEY